VHGAHICFVQDQFLAQGRPLANISRGGVNKPFALQWLCGLLTNEGVSITPDVKDAVWKAISLASAPQSERTLTSLSVLLQSNALRQALQPYTFERPLWSSA